jgi:UDP-glucose 4-epimerase
MSGPTEVPAELSGSSVLVTGGAGFIGSHIASALAAECEVTVLDNLSARPRENVPDGVRFVEGDIRDPATLSDAAAGVDVIFHEAAVVSVEESVENPERTHAVNETGTLKVLEAARRVGARVVFASSAAIYGHPEKVPVSESDRKEPTSPYGISKLAGDHYVRRYADLYDVPTVALRYFNVYGPGQTGGDYAGVINIFFEQARTGDPLTVHGDGSQTRDFVHVDDVVQANLLAAVTDAVGRAFNIGTGGSVTVEELAAAIRETVGSDSDSVHTEGRTGDIDRSRADIERAVEVLGYEPTVDLEEGLATVAGDRSG